MHFSVITPSHNRRRYLPEAVASVQASISAPLDFSFDHLIYDNGSTDGTGEWLRQAAADTPNLRTWTHPEPLKAGYARNRIIRETPSDAWLVPLDDDDILLQRTLYHYADLVRHHPDAPWFVADFLRIDQDGHYLPNEDYYAWRFDSVGDMLGAIFRGEHFIQGNVCYSRSLFDKVGGYDAGLPMAEDLDLYVRFLLAGHLPVVSPHINHLHRFHTSNVSIGVDGDKHAEDLRAIYAKYAPQLQAAGVSEPGR
ncbi:glycosyl transferase family 2 [Hymenobacter roseosalivarius DSM 11622]|uniref:Glycosyl transferase family 2 n=1 Tax=Hymenobacter roseosalivarius DSM 11622 TaxID=645990 RepID=A0A1W1W2B4_9BACT|nr:glycosyltransferase [Hymenobacter roseosalivarius]SMB99748.1 glycosyl transferase family 2 [Hymenobacter roseosalivarius DSM 11622]